MVYEKNVLFEKKRIKLCNEGHFVENKTEIMQHVLKGLCISLFSAHIK